VQISGPFLIDNDTRRFKVDNHGPGGVDKWYNSYPPQTE